MELAERRIIAKPGERKFNMKRYRSRAPKNKSLDGLSAVLWIIFGIPALIIWVFGAVFGGKRKG